MLASAVRAGGRRVGIARVSAGAWSAATQRRVALRRELRSLRKERDTELSALGTAAYNDDADQMRALRGRVAELKGRIEGCERASDDAIERARDRVRRKRAESRRTQPRSV